MKTHIVTMLLQFVMLPRLKQKEAWQMLLGKPKSFMNQKMMVFIISEYLGMELGGEEATRRPMGWSQHCQL